MPHPNIYPYDKVQSRTKPIFLAVGNNGQFRRLCAAIGAPELGDDPRFASNADRSTNRVALKQLLEDKLADQDGDELCLRLLRENVPAGPVNTIPEVMAAPHTLHRQMRVTDGDYAATGIPVKLSRTPGSVRALPPLFGESSREVLREAGYSEPEIAELVAAGVVPEQRRA